MARPHPINEPPASRTGPPPLNDSLVVDFLVQITENAAQPLEWADRPDGGFTARWNEVDVEVCLSHGMGVARLYLALRFRDQEVYLAEPVSLAFFGWKPEEEAQRNLSESMRRLERLASCQVAARRKRSALEADRIRGEIYRRLLFGEAVAAQR